MTALDRFGELAATHERCFWLDGGGSQPWSGRRSIVGWLDEDDISLTYDVARGEVVEHPSGRVVGTDVFDVLQDLQDGDPETHWVGFFGYAARPDLPARPMTGVPDAVWMRTRTIEITDEPGRAPKRPSGRPSEHSTPRWYAEAFAAVQEQLHAGNSYEVNLTYRTEESATADPLEVYARMRATNPAPYAGVLKHSVDGRDTWLLSASPERFATVDRHRRAETRPIKGTTPRGETPDADEALRHSLATDPKFRAENLMITDLLRNDLAMVCDVGSVAVPALLAVESYPTVHQLVSTVRGRLREDVSTVAALRALFPAGSMTGAPKLRTMEVIEEVEATPRVAYAGAFGWLAADGRADLGVIIRSLTTAGDGRYRLGTGGGITVQSSVDDEYAESRWKAERLLTSLLPLAEA